MPKSYEGGIRPIRLEFVRETNEAEAPTDPTWEAYSDNIRTFEPEITPGLNPQFGLGSAGPNDFFTGTGEFSVTVSYDLQRWFESGGNPNDAAYDGLVRDADERLPNTHTVVRRMSQSDLDADNTVNGSTSYDTRQYFVLKGGYVDTVTVTGDPTSAQPVLVELEYMFRKAEAHQIDQPSSSTELTVVSSSANDTTQSVTIEDEGAGTSDTVALSGTSVQSTSSPFSDIDSISLDAETEGDITVSINDGSVTSPTEGDALSVIRGKNSFDFNEGELGVPALGSGSHAGSVGTSYETVQGDNIERPNGTTVGDEINTVSFIVENDVSNNESTSGNRPILNANGYTVTAEATLFGEVEHIQNLQDALTSTSNDLRWEMTGGNLQIDSAHINEVGGTEEAQQGVKEVDVTFIGTQVTFPA